MNININNNFFKVKPVFTQRDIQNGMMNKKFNDSFNGMLFLMNPGEHCFWMKNCITSLDIIFIEDRTITKVYRDCQPCSDEECENYCGEGNLILEIEGGSCELLGINEGDSIRFI